MFFKKLAGLALLAGLACTFVATPGRAVAQAGDKVLAPADVQKLLPDRLWYKGQAAPSQLRNSGGVKFADGSYMLATLVDTSGYSSDVQAKYQAYFITETPLKVGSQTLPAGIYGVGFIGDNKFVVTDVGAHDVFTIDSSNDDAMKRPRPLQVVADASGGFRLYVTRRYIAFSKQ
ncbi:MAG TPA: hypothetical protein VGJ21_02700 [Terracidiphilus sp.]|jgi:hypothetical protein